MANQILTEQEMKLFGVGLSIMGAWAEEYMKVKDGLQTYEEAFNNFNEYLTPVGQIFAIAMTLPGMAEQYEDMISSTLPGDIF